MGLKLVGRVVVGVLILVLVTWAIFPFYWMLASSLKLEMSMYTMPPKWLFTPTLKNYESLFARSEFLGFVRNSFVATLSSTAISVILGSMAGYALARGRFKKKQFIAFWIITTRMAPIVVVMVPLYVLFSKLGLMGTIYGLIVAYTTFNLPFAIWLMKSFFEDIPKTMEEAAMVDGCGTWRAFWHVALPLVRPGIVAVATLCFIFAWNDYEFAVIFTSGNTQTLPVAIARLITQEGIVWGQVMTNGIMLLAPVLIIGLLIRKHLVRGLTMGAVSGE